VSKNETVILFVVCHHGRTWIAVVSEQGAEERGTLRHPYILVRKIEETS
jgi:hypothetical protein